VASTADYGNVAAFVVPGVPISMVTFYAGLPTPLAWAERVAPPRALALYGVGCCIALPRVVG